METVRNLGMATRLDQHVNAGNQGDAQLVLDGLIISYVGRLMELDAVSLDVDGEHLKDLNLSLLKRQWDLRPPLTGAPEALKAAMRWPADWSRYKAYVEAADNRYAHTNNPPGTAKQ
jgi:hypothetical protein